MTRPTGKIGPSKRYTTLMPPHDNCYNQLNTAPVRSNPAGTTTIYHFKYDVTMKTSYWEKANHPDCDATDHHHHRERPARRNRRRREGSRLPEPVRNHSRSGPRGLAARSAGRHAVGTMRGGAGVCLRSRRARSVKAPGAELPWPPRSVAGDAARSSRRRHLHGGDGAEGTFRRRPAFRRPHHRRTRRALRSRGDDPDLGKQETSYATQAQARLKSKAKALVWTPGGLARANSSRHPGWFPHLAFCSLEIVIPAFARTAWNCTLSPTFTCLSIAG